MNTERELADVLAPCPFCGGAAKVVSYRSCDCCGKKYNGMVMCSVCAATVDHRDNDADAIAAWNRRPALLSRADGGEDSARYQWLKAGGLYRIGFDSVGGTSLDGLDAAVDDAMAKERGE